MLLEIENSELLHMLEDPASLQGKVRAYFLYSTWRSKYTVLWYTKSSESLFKFTTSLNFLRGSQFTKTPCRWRRQWQCCKPIRLRLKPPRSRSPPHLPSHSTITALILFYNSSEPLVCQSVWGFQEEGSISRLLYFYNIVDCSFLDLFDAVSKGDIVSTCALFNGGILNKDMNILLNNLFRSNT